MSGYPYKTHWACLPCRHTAKFLSEQWECMRVAPTCPRCRAKMVHLGRDFHAPRRADTNQWRKVAVLYAAGITFDSCGCTGPGYRPRTLADAKADLRDARRPVRPPYYQRPYERFLREVAR
jgi:hypothetical protein